jgi:hypothetical protein
MAGIIGLLTFGAALSAALLLVVAGFEAPIRASAELHVKGNPTAPMRRVREWGLWCALFALVGTYLVAVT